MRTVSRILCRREGLNANVYYRWSKEFLEAGKKRLSGDTRREATSGDLTQNGGLDVTQLDGAHFVWISTIDSNKAPDTYRDDLPDPWRVAEQL